MRAPAAPMPLLDCPVMTTAVSTGDLLEGRFRIRTEQLRQGGRAIYFGIDTHNTHRRCEIHLLEPSAPDSLQVEFAREVELLGRIDHPGCLSAIALGGLPGGTLYYVVHERFAARLADRIGTKLAPSHVGHVATQLLGALHQIHQLDWRLGWLTPDAVDERTEDGLLLVRIVRMSAARPVDGVGPVPAGDALAFADPRLTDGTKPTIASDLFAVGRVIHQLATGSLAIPLVADPNDATGNELPALVGRLCGSEAAVNGFSSADAAAKAFERLSRAAGDDAPLAVSPSPHRSRFRTSDVEIMTVMSPAAEDKPRSSAAGTVAARDPSSSRSHVRTIQPRLPTSLEDAGAPKDGRRNIWLAAIAAAGVVAIVAIATNRSTNTSTNPEPETDATKHIAVAGTPAAEVPELPASQDPRDALVRLNQPDPARALPFIERHALLDRVAARADLRSRVNLRWNRLLDLAQSADAPKPCSTFRDALSDLDLAPLNEAEKSLIASIRVPSPTTVLGAGLPPDGDCDGLDDAFKRAGTRTESLPPTPPPPASSEMKRSRRVRPPARRAPSPSADEQPEPRATQRHKRTQIAQPLADDIKGLD